MAATPEWYAGKHSELTRLIRARNRFDRSTGLPAARAAQTAAHEAEWKALATLMLTIPRSEAEATAKRRYVNRNPLTREWWEATGAVPLIHEGLMRVRAGEAADNWLGTR